MGATASTFVVSSSPFAVSASSWTLVFYFASMGAIAFAAIEGAVSIAALTRMFSRSLSCRNHVVMNTASGRMSRSAVAVEAAS